MYYHLFQKWKYDSQREEQIKDSLLVEGRHIPDNNLTIKTSEGQRIPLGTIIPKEFPSGQNHWYWYNDYSEYVIPKEENIMVRYVIRFGDGTKTYTRKDLYMADGIESQSNVFCASDDDMDSRDQAHKNSESEDERDDNDSFGSL